MNYYNEIDPHAAAWIRELIATGQIPDGYVDERSIKDVQPDELISYTQCHFFAGIAGWSLALKLASVSPSTALWTGSCPCQPFSVAGKRKGTDDERHLWPDFLRLIEACRPSIVLGEQVASADGRVWLSGVQTDLEALDFEFGAADLCAAGIGADHIRQRLYWLAHHHHQGPQGRHIEQRQRACECAVGPGGVGSGLADTMHTGRPERWPGTGTGQTFGSGSVVRMGDTEIRGDGSLNGQPESRFGQEVADRRSGVSRSTRPHPSPACGPTGGTLDPDLDNGICPDRGSQCSADTGSCRLAHPDGPSQGEGWSARPVEASGWRTCGGLARHGSPRIRPAWSSAEWIYCRDGKYRRAQPGIFPLAYGVPRGMGPSWNGSTSEVVTEKEANESQEARIMRLRGYGNAIVPPLAAEFIGAVFDILEP